jgi:uncharacterized membrane protein
MKKIYTLLACALVVTAISCAKKTTAVSDTKKASVTYALNIQPLIESKCAPCHLPAKGGNKTDFSTYEAAKAYVNPMITRVQLAPTEKNFMPFKNEALSTEEIALIKKWKEEGLAK